MQALGALGHSPVAASRRDGVDLTNYQQVEDFFAKTKPSVIFNCAAHVGSLHYVTTYAAQVVHDNIQMALNLYKAAAKVCPGARIINPLSNCSYPGAADVQKENEWWSGPVHDSVFSYGNAKRFIYVLSKCYAKEYGIGTANFLVPNTFGPGDATDPNKTHALNGMIIRMLGADKNNDQTFEVWGTGSPIREWAYVDDVVKVLIAGMDTNLDILEPVNVAQNKGYTIKESGHFIAEAIGFKGELVFNTKYPDGAPVKLLDATRFQTIFPDFQFSDHKEGIAKTVSYYKSIL